MAWSDRSTTILVSLASVFFTAAAVVGCADSSGTPSPITDPTQPSFAPLTPVVDTANLPLRPHDGEIPSVDIAAADAGQGPGLESSLGFSPASTDPIAASTIAVLDDAAVRITPAIQAKAEELGLDPRRIYAFVRNEIDFELYFGSVKGANETLLQRAGNDYDIASLLIALLRASGVEATYARGTVRVGVVDAMSWVGVLEPEAAFRVIASSGVPGRALRDTTGRLVAFELEHVWVELPSTGEPRTQTQGGWGSEPNGANPGAVLAANFVRLFPNGLLLGDRYDGTDSGGASVRYSSASSVSAQLPSGGRAKALGFTGTRTGPVSSSQGESVLLGQVLAASLNLAFSDNAGSVDTLGTPVFSTKLGDLRLIVAPSPLASQTVRQVVTLGNRVLGGAVLPAGVTFSDLVGALTTINEAYVDGSASSLPPVLDASFKRHTVELGRNIFAEAGLHESVASEIDQVLFDPELEFVKIADPVLRELNHVDPGAIDEFLRERQKRALAWVRENDPNLTLTQTIGGQTIIAEPVAALPTRHPLEIRSTVTRFESIPSPDRQTVRVTAFGYDTTLELAAISGSRVTVGFQPASATDQAIVDGFGGLLDTPAGAASYRPTLVVDGSVVAVGGAAQLGTFFRIFVEFRVRGSSLGTVSHNVTTGGTYALTLNTQSIPLERMEASKDRLVAARAAGKDDLSEEVAGEALHLLGLAWHRYNDVITNSVVQTAKGRYSKPEVSEALVGFDMGLRVENGRVRMSLGQQFIDVQRNVVSMASRTGDPAFPKAEIFFTAGVAGSYAEQAIFQNLCGAPALSTIGYLREAANEDIPIFSVNHENLAAVLPRLDLPAFTKQLVQTSVQSGKTVIVHAQQTSFYGAQPGAGLIVYDQTTGAGAYLITRAIFGGQRLLDNVTEVQTSAEQKGFWGKSLDFITAAGYKFVVGDFDKNSFDSNVEGVGGFVGQLVSGVLIFGDVRDGTAAAKLLYKTGGEDGKLDLTFSVVGLVPGPGDALKAAKPFAPDVIEALGKIAGLAGDEAIAFLKTLPPDRLKNTLEGLLKRSDAGIESVTATKITTLGPDGEIIEHAGASMKLHVGEIDLNVITVEKGDDLVRGLNIDGLPPTLTDLSTAQKGEVGEALARRLAADRGLDALSTVKSSTAPGVDSVFRDADGGLVVFEVKFTSSDKNTGVGSLGTQVTNNVTEAKIPQKQLSEQWLLPTFVDGVKVNDGALARSVEEGTITKELADEIEQAVKDGTLRREVVVVRNGDAGSVTRTLGSDPALGVGSTGGAVKVTQINLGQVIK